MHVPIEIASDRRAFGYTQEINVGITRTAGARVSIIADLGGTLHTLEYGFETPYGAPQGAVDVNKFWRTFSPQGIELGPEPGMLSPVSPYQATITVVVQRRTKSDNVICSISSLELYCTVSEG